METSKPVALEPGIPTVPRIDTIDRRTDIVFVLFYYAESIRGVTRVQKLLFLIEKETTLLDTYEEVAMNFAPYKMGPFSEHVYEELQFLLQLDALEAQPIADETTGEPADSDLEHSRFVITSKGEKIAAQLVEILDRDHREAIQDIVDTHADKPLTALLRYVYSEYPEYATESEISDEVRQEGEP